MQRIIRNVILCGLLSFIILPVTPEDETYKEAFNFFLKHTMELISQKEKSTFSITLSEMNLCILGYKTRTQPVQPGTENGISEDAKNTTNIETDGILVNPDGEMVNQDVEIVKSNGAAINPDAEAIETSPANGDFPAAEAGSMAALTQKLILETGKELEDCQLLNDAHKTNELELENELEECQLQTGTQQKYEIELEKELEECQLLTEAQQKLKLEEEKELEDCQYMTDAHKAYEIELEKELEECQLLTEAQQKFKLEEEKELEECQFMNDAHKTNEIELENELEECQLLTATQQETVDIYNELLPYSRKLLDYVTTLLLEAKYLKENYSDKKTCEEKMAKITAALQKFEDDLNNAHKEIYRLKNEDASDEMSLEDYDYLPDSYPDEELSNLVIAEPQLRGKVTGLGNFFNDRRGSFSLWQRQINQLREQVGRLTTTNEVTVIKVQDGSECGEFDHVQKVTFLLNDITEIGITDFIKEDNRQKVRYTITFTFSPSFMPTSNLPGELPVAITLTATVAIKANTVRKGGEFIRLVHLTAVEITSVIFKNQDQLSLSDSQISTIKDEIQSQVNVEHFFNLIWEKMSVAIGNEDVTEYLMR